MRKSLRPWLLGAGICALLFAVLLAGLLFAHRTPTGRVVRVGVYENPPKIYTLSDGRPAGLFIDLLLPIAQDEHWALHFVHCPWEECLQKLRDHDIDLMPDVAFTADRARNLDFPATAVAHAWSEVYARKSLAVRSVSDLAGLRIALPRDSVQQYNFGRLMKGVGLQFIPVPAAGYAEAFRDVRDGRADAVVSNNFYDAQHPATPSLAQTPIVFQPAGVYFATAKGRNGELLQAIDRHLRVWLQDPDSIYFKALRQSMAPAPLEVIPAWLRIGLLASIGLVAVFVPASLVLRWQVRQRTADLARTNQHLDEVLHASPAVIYRLQLKDGHIVPDWVSPNIQRLFGFTVDEVVSPHWWQNRLYPNDLEKAMSIMMHLPHEGSVIHEYRIIDARGAIRFIRDELHVYPTQNGLSRMVIGAWSDLTESYQHAQRADFLKSHDSLTRLPNRFELSRRLTQAIERARARHHELVLLWIDLDRFKNINDTLGHAAGNDILLQVSLAIRQAIDPSDIVSRIGGDEFLVLFEREIGPDDAISMAERIRSIFSTPMTVGGRTQALSCSIGISVYPSNGEDADTLLYHAEVAMYEAKNLGRNTCCLFDERLASQVLERLNMESALRGAIDRDELVLHYQPQVSLESGKPVGIEALVRWNHPELGLLSPSHFIELAEECGLIDQIGQWVLAEACRQMVEWRSRGLDVPQMSVNLSVRQIERSELIQQIGKVLAASGLDAASLELEVTESMIMRDPEQAVETLAALKKLGVKLSIDDFGTGHSSLAYLKQLPLDQLKIDRAFVRDIGNSDNDETICRAVIDLARQLGLTTVAEGVEREVQAAFLRREGCKIAQGYLFCKPLPVEDLAVYWNQRQTVTPMN
ncbi:MAG TPA: EAL domain-containing protein [Rhodanobacteraceae bacterium]|nr:EAL domain-containing protein [Rhodanobacteraceae bacterium]